MGDDKRSKLITVRAESLADALLELASRHDDVAETVERLLASPEENLVRFRTHLKSFNTFRERGAFFDWQEHPTHRQYVAGIRKAHGRKWSFWQRVEEYPIEKDTSLPYDEE